MDRATAHQSILRTLDATRSRLRSWSVSWTSEIDTDGRTFAPENGRSELRSWGNLLYYETNLLLQRYSLIPISPEEKLYAIHNFLQSCNEVYGLNSTLISRYLSDPMVTSASLIYPIMWTFGHSVMSAGLDLVKLKGLSVEGSQEPTFRACVTLLAHLEGDRNMMLEGFTHALTSLYSPSNS